jgi:hypothetical protein
MKNAQAEYIQPQKADVKEIYAIDTPIKADDPRAVYPGVDLAYELALASYETAQTRLDVLDKRLETLIALGATASLAVPVIASGKNISFNSIWFFCASAAFVLATVVGITARLSKSLKLIDPAKLYTEFLHCSEWEFKKNIIFFAGQHFDVNIRLVNWRGRMAAWTAILFLVELIFVAIWLIHPLL